jgi:hypothetical protein
MEATSMVAETKEPRGGTLNLSEASLNDEVSKKNEGITEMEATSMVAVTGEPEGETLNLSEASLNDEEIKKNENITEIETTSTVTETEGSEGETLNLSETSTSDGGITQGHFAQTHQVNHVESPMIISDKEEFEWGISIFERYELASHDPAGMKRKSSWQINVVSAPITKHEYLDTASISKTSEVTAGTKKTEEEAIDLSRTFIFGEEIVQDGPLQECQAALRSGKVLPDPATPKEKNKEKVKRWYPKKGPYRKYVPNSL